MKMAMLTAEAMNSEANYDHSIFINGNKDDHGY